MSNYRIQRNYENLERTIFSGVGHFEIPQIQPVDYEGGCEFIGFNYAKSCKNCGDKGVHFFLDDYQFNRLWASIDRYMPMLSRFRYVMSPDFSTYTDFPKVIQIYNHYTVAVSSVGCMKSAESKRLFIDGYREMARRLHPEKIIFYGNVPPECTGNIVRIKAFQDKFKEALCDGW